MKILIVSRGLPTEKYPLNGVFEFDQAKALSASGVDVVFFALDIRSIRRKRRFGIIEENREGIECFTVSIPVGAVPYRIRAFFARKGLRLLYKKVFSEGKKPDIIHAHFTFQGYVAASLSIETGIPLVITEHSSDMNKDVISKDNYEMGLFGYNNASCVIAVSHALAGNIEKHFGIKCKVIPNIVDTDLFLYKPDQVNDRED